jgi:DnaK suppressor protein
VAPETGPLGFAQLNRAARLTTAGAGHIICGFVRLRDASKGHGPKAAMDKKRLEGFKKRLEQRQQELRRAVVRTEEDGRAADQDTAQDIADRASSSYNKEFLFHQSNNERQLLQMVEGALNRIREGTYGQCISCGNEINPKRLEAVPWTRHCIECQEKLEKGILETSMT